MEITDEKIFKIALITTLIGIVGLIIFSGFIEPKEVKISEIDRSMIEEEVVITGVIESVKKSSTSNTYFLEINDGTGKLAGMMFESTVIELEELDTPPEMFLNQKVRVSGTLTEYKSTMEIIVSNANSIKIVN
ncbi:OB-fold nucleic acid binding domain-containing protein [Methanobrevibacter sp. DSM 116169]|uniref:OB-fold nucleic acid binding domain-containing protein n=1 Tax=Methanobrevibacter sp. DSM 116169 TaxID=3242727 RepID=UPI0038FC3D41